MRTKIHFIRYEVADRRWFTIWRNGPTGIGLVVGHHYYGVLVDLGGDRQ